MGRIRTKSKKTNIIADTPAQPKPSKSSSAIPALFEKAQALVAQCNYELAQKFAFRILESEPRHADAREILGVCQLEMGELDEAKQTFSTLIPPCADAPKPPPPSAYLYLAQLSVDDPWEALRLYEAAIDILHSQLKGKERALAGSDDAASEELGTKNAIVRALVGMVEIWMDPSYELCDLPQAETTCEDLLNKAQQVDPGNTEALQALASVRMSQSRPDDAKRCLEQAWSSWKDFDPDDSRVPAQETRLAFVKLCLELELFNAALVVLQGIMADDDQDVEAWYLEGWCFFLMAEQARESDGTLDDLTWQDLAKDARDCLETCHTLHTNQEHPDQPMLIHTQELIRQLDLLGINASAMEEREEEGDEDWEDANDEEDIDMT